MRWFPLASCKGAIYTHEDLQKKMEKDHAGMCGLLCRVCAVLEIPWNVRENEAPYESQIRGVREHLNKIQFPEKVDEPATVEPNNEVNGVDVPFG